MPQTPLTRFKLRIGEHEIWLPSGRFVIGRSSRCQIVLDDPLVSRRHAEMIVEPEAATIADLNSINGVHVNGEPLLGEPRMLEDGDHIVVGSRELVFLRAAQEDQPRPPAGDTLSGLDPVVPAVGDADEPSAETARADVWEVLGTAADHALNAGRLGEAQGLLTQLLMAALRDTKSGIGADPRTSEKAIEFAMRLARATGSGTWFDYVVDVLYYSRRLPMPWLLEEMSTVLAKVDAVDIPRLGRLVSSLETLVSDEPAEQDLVRAAAQLLARAGELQRG
jgi:pSer/pThr/pTyr-binding forkhead associated (FHA) protein